MVVMDSEREKMILQARSLSSKMNDPVLIEGILPASANEAAVEELFAKEQGIRVGDEITLEHDGNLVSDTFRVTAIVNELYFCCATIQDARGKSTQGLGSASYYIVLPIEAFDASYYSDCFTTAYVKNHALDEYYYFSDEYKEQEAAFKEKLETLRQERAKLRYDSLSEDAQTEITSAEEELADSEKELSEAANRIREQKERNWKQHGEKSKCS